MGDIIRGLFKDRSDSALRCSAVIAAGGIGSRMNLSFNKIFLAVDDKPILAYTLDAFEDTPCVEEIILVCNENDIPLCHEVVNDFEYSKVKSIVKGGQTRQESIQIGLKEVSEEYDLIITHDAARPLVTSDLITAVAQCADETGAATAGVKPVDTVKILQGNQIKDTLDRDCLILVQTPQAFRKSVLVRAHEHAKEEHIQGTDDCVLVEKIGQTVTAVPGNYNNIKLTTPDDFITISAYLNMKEEFE